MKRILIIACCIPLMLFCSALHSQSLYLISDINSNPTPIQSYDIVGDGLVLQEENLIPYYGYGAVGMAIDSDSAFLFITYENSDTIQLINAELMDSVGFVIAPGAVNLSGIVYDKTNKHVYTVDRTTDNLYSYAWDAGEFELTLDLQTDLEGATAWGIFLDEMNGLLYVANGETITYYSTTTWNLVGTLDGLLHSALNVEKDLDKDYLYFGGGFEGNYHITRYDLSSDEQEDAFIGYEGGLIGITINQLTGYIYISTGYNGMPGNGENKVKIYNSDLELLYETDDLGGDPTDIATALVFYNPLDLNIDTVDCVVPGGQINYNICYESQVAFEVSGVSLIAQMPDFTTYASSSGSGVYNASQNNVVWSIGNVPAWTSQVCFELTLDISTNLPVPSTIDLPVTINGNEIGQTTKTLQTPTCLNPQAFFVSDITICYGETGHLSIDLSGVPPWDLVFSDGISQDTIFNITQSPLHLQVNAQYSCTYELVYIYGGNGMETSCNSTATVTVNPLPEPSIIGNDTVCSYSFGMEYLTNFNLGNTYDWDISGGEISVGQNTSTVQVDWLQDMNGSISVNEKITSTGCENQDVFDVKIHESPYINFVTNDTTLCPIGDTLFLFPQVDGGNSSVLWTSSDVSSPWHNFTGDSIYVFTTGVGFYFATYYLYMINDKGCSDTDSIRVVFDFTACEGGVDQQTDNSGIRIFPIPTRNRLEIEFVKSFRGTMDIHILDITGKKILSTEVNILNGIHNKVIDISSLDVGVYFIQIFGDEVIYMKKIIIQ